MNNNTKKVFKYIIKTPLGIIELIKPERFSEVIETINMAIRGNTKVLGLIIKDKRFQEILSVVDLIKASPEELQIISKQKI